MKTKIAIIIFLAISLIGAFNLKAQQPFVSSSSGTMTAFRHEKTDTISGNEYRLADETTLSYTKNDAKIECDNETIAAKIIKAHDQIIKRFTRTWKKDRHGSYKHYVIYLNKKDAELIKSWAKSNL